MSGYATVRPPSSWPTATTATSNRIRWGGEAAILVLAAAFSTLLGAAMGLIWPRLAPHIDVINAYYRGSVEASKALLGDDVWFAFLGIVAGIVAVLLLAAGDFARGPGAVIGVALGGVLGSLVAAHVGTTVQQPHIVSLVHANVPNVAPADISRILMFFNFRVRAHAAILAWPFTAVVLVGLNVIVRYLRNPDD
jgi:hypothetical protein